jgi:hypothetical protein
VENQSTISQLKDGAKSEREGMERDYSVFLFLQSERDTIQEESIQFDSTINNNNLRHNIVDIVT